MTPEEFVHVLEEWSTVGGSFPRFAAHDIATAAEAEAVCNALASPHVYAVNGIEMPALFDLAAFFQSVEAREAFDIFRDRGLPVLRRILRDALNRPPETGEDDWAVTQRREADLFVVKILALYCQRDDGARIVEAARDPRLSNGYLWSTIFGIVAEQHPDAIEISERLKNPLPDGYAGLAYLDFANALACNGTISQHPFDSDAGIARLCGYLGDRNPESYGDAVSAAAGIPFVNAAARDMLLGKADHHPDSLVRLEAAWAYAKTGSEFGRQRLAQLCLNPRLAERAIRYLEELGLDAHIPAKARDPDFRAMAQMCSWLMHPNEFGRPPDQITQYDTRELNWPPSRERCRLWLFKYRYEPRDDGAGAQEGVGLVGPVTFALRDATADLAPEDVYGLHCCRELRWSGDPRAPETCTAAAGRNIIAEINPGFARA